MDRSVNMLRMVVDAKFETYELIRKRLKEENTNLQTQLDRAMNQQ